MTNLFLDTFNRADSTDMGTNWAERLGNFNIVSNQLNLNTNTGTQEVAHTAATFTTADYSVSSELYWSGISNSFFGVGGRRVNFGATDSDYYFAFASQGLGKVRLFKRIGSTNTQLGSDATVTINTATTYTLSLSMQGSTITVLWNGAQIIQVTDTALTAAGGAAVMAAGGADVNVIKWDNFTVDDLTSSKGQKLVKRLSSSGTVTTAGKAGILWGYELVGGTTASKAIFNNGGSSGTDTWSGTTVAGAAVGNVTKEEKFTKGIVFDTDIYVTLTGTNAYVYVTYEQIEN